eukprot:1643112-Pyramimonas_sp.AAC.1
MKSVSPLKSASTCGPEENSSRCWGSLARCWGSLAQCWGSLAQCWERRVAELGLNTDNGELTVNTLLSQLTTEEF